MQVRDGGADPENELGDGHHDDALGVGSQGGHDVPLPGLGVGEVEGEDEGHDEAVDGDHGVPGEVDALGHHVPPHEAPVVSEWMNHESYSRHESVLAS